MEKMQVSWHSVDLNHYLRVEEETSKSASQEPLIVLQISSHLGNTSLGSWGRRLDRCRKGFGTSDYPKEGSILFLGLQDLV